MSCVLFGENTAFRDKKLFPSVKHEGGGIMDLGQEKKSRMAYTLNFKLCEALVLGW